MFEAVSLDFGGTLAYEVKGDYVVYQEILGELGYNVELGILEKAFRGAMDWWRKEKARTDMLWNEETDAVWFERILCSLTVADSRRIAAKMVELCPLRSKTICLLIPRRSERIDFLIPT